MHPTTTRERRISMDAPVTCRYCDRPIEAGKEGVQCPRCKALHHVACWKEKGGCATRGCKQVGTVIRAEAPPPSENRHRKPPVWRAHPVLTSVSLVLLVGATLVYGVRQARTNPALTQGTELHVMIWNSPDSNALRTSIAGYLSRRKPDLVIEVESVPLGIPGAAAGGAASTMLYEQKLVITIAARAAPDIFALPSDRLAVYAEKGALLPLDPYVDEAKGRRRPGRARGRVGGHLYALPNPAGEGWLAIWRGTPHPAAAWELLSYLVSDLSDLGPQ